MYRRVTQTVQDRGELVRLEDVEKAVKSRSKDWYYSPYVYSDEVVEYWNNNLICTTKNCKNKKKEGDPDTCTKCGKGRYEPSIKGYNGEAWTDVLYWDLDCEGDFEKVRQSALSLVEYLDDKGLGDGIEFYFSGNKGVHVLLHTENKFTPKETSVICYKIAKDAGVNVSDNILDTSVYNITRIFRFADTRHPKSKLYKIRLTDDELANDSIEQIHVKAKKIRKGVEFPKITKVDAEKFRKLAEKPKKKESNLISFETMKAINIDGPDTHFDPRNAPQGKRRCIYVLENGYIAPGERHNAVIRMAAYYKAKGTEYDQAYRLIVKALERRVEIYPDANEFEEEELNRDIGEVYSDSWNGGAFSCKDDAFLQSKCDLGDGPCYYEHHKTTPSAVVNIAGLFDKYLEYGDEALEEYPKTGVEWLDKKLRLRPRNFSIINGANGSGKTSLMINMIHNLNKQKIYHLVFSLDMADTSFFEKLGATFTDYSQEQIEEAFNVHSRNPKVIQEVAAALRDSLPYTLFDFTSAADSKHLEKVLNRLKVDEGLDIRVAFVDYAGRLIGSHDNEFANSSENALMANDIAKRTGVHLIYLSQVSREKGDHTTSLRSSRIAKHSGAWEENATIILNVWRPFGNGLQGNDNYIHLYIAKNRSGSLGERALWWEGKTGLIRELSKPEFDHYKTQCIDNEIDVPYEQFHDNKIKNDRNLRPTLDEVANDSRFVSRDDEKKLPRGKRSFRRKTGSHVSD